MKENKVGLPIEQSLGSPEGINFLSVHGSKGLEFKVVFLIGATEREWKAKDADSVH